MFDGTSLLAAWFCAARNITNGRLLVYFRSGVYIFYRRELESLLDGRIVMGWSG
jgi:hypothetical protein